MEEDMGLSFDATIKAIDARSKLHIPIFSKKDDENSNEEEDSK
jgi:hypothetical protein